MSRSSVSSLFFVGIVALIVILIVKWAFFEGPGLEQEAAEIEQMPESTAESFKLAPPGTRVAISAVLVDNPTLKDDLVAYNWQAWSNCERRGGCWDKPQTTSPRLTVQLDGQVILVEKSNSLLLEGHLHEHIYPTTGGKLRFQGLVNGDTVTVVGTRTGQGTLQPSRLFLGTRAELVAKLKHDSDIRSGAWITLPFCGAIIFLWFILKRSG